MVGTSFATLPIDLQTNSSHAGTLEVGVYPLLCNTLLVTFSSQIFNISKVGELLTSVPVFNHLWFSLYQINTCSNLYLLPLVISQHTLEKSLGSILSTPLGRWLKMVTRSLFS